jgi:hypothetical protein
MNFSNWRAKIQKENLRTEVPKVFPRVLSKFAILVVKTIFFHNGVDIVRTGMNSRIEIANSRVKKTVQDIWFQIENMSFFARQFEKFIHRLTTPEHPCMLK